MVVSGEQPLGRLEDYPCSALREREAGPDATYGSRPRLDALEPSGERAGDGNREGAEHESRDQGEEAVSRMLEELGSGVRVGCDDPIGEPVRGDDAERGGGPENEAGARPRPPSHTRMVRLRRTRGTVVAIAEAYFNRSKGYGFAVTAAETRAGPRRIPRIARKVSLQLFVLAVAVHFLLPQLSGLRDTGHALAHAAWWVPLIVVALEAASLLSYAELLRTALLCARSEAPRGFLQRTVVAGLALGRTLPGGTTAALPVIVGSLRGAGLDAAVATASMAASGLISSLVLALLLPIGALLAFASGTTGGSILGIAGLATVLIALIVAVRPILKHPETAGAVVQKIVRGIARGPLRHRVDPEQVGEAVARALMGAGRLASDRRGLTVAGAWATANWLFDAAALTMLAVTIGTGTPLGALLLAYVVAQLAAAVPLTPGGIGVVETAMTGVLVAAGAPAAAATATVLSWRLVSFWLPILVGLALVPTLHGRNKANKAP